MPANNIKSAICQNAWIVAVAKLFHKVFRTFLSVSTIHGLNHIAEHGRHPVEKLIWCSLVCLAIYGAAILSSLTLTRYRENPTVISMERDRFSWNTSFPAGTICPTFKLDQFLLNQYIENSTASNKTALREFIISLSEATYETFDTVTNYDKISPDSYMHLLMQLRFKFAPYVSNSGSYKYEYGLQRIISEMGICYVFNSQLAVYSSPEYWESGQWKLVKEKDTFYVNILDGDVFTNIVNMSTGFRIYLHGPYEVADVASKGVFSLNGYLVQIHLTALSILSTSRTKDLTVGQRKCRFYYESDLRHSPVYSYVLCRTECRINLAKKLCGCLPHFYRKLDGELTCNVSGLHCLANYKERLIALNNECTCLPNCDDVNYVVDDVESQKWFLGSNLQWGLKEYPAMRLKRDIIFGLSDLLVYVGGMAGLFLGCSVLSFIEVLYFFTIRLFWFVHNYMKNRSS